MIVAIGMIDVIVMIIMIIVDNYKKLIYKYYMLPFILTIIINKMDWLEIKPIGYKDFFNDYMINQLMEDSIINEWINDYIYTDPIYRPNIIDILDFKIIRRLSLFEISCLLSLFDDIKDLPSMDIN